MDSERDSSKRQVASYLLLAAFFLFVSFTFGRTKVYGDGMFWDGRVYAKALAVWHAGGDPYAGDSSSLLFVSPPLVLKSAAIISEAFRGHTGWFCYIGIIVLAMLSLPYLLTRFYIRSTWMTPVAAILLFATQPHFMVERSMISGNVAVPLYALALLAGVPGLRRNRWFWFYAIVFIAALIKPSFLALLVLPVLAGTRQFLRAAATTAGVGALYILQKLTMPVLYGSFKVAVYRQVILKHDFGIGSYNCFYFLGGRLHILRNMEAASLLHFVLLAILLSALFLLRGDPEHPVVRRLWVPLLLVAAIVANPRMQDYDSNFAILPALYIWIESIRDACQTRRGTAFVAFGVNLLVVLFTRDYEIGIDSVLLGALGLGLFQIARARRSQTLQHETPLDEKVDVAFDVRRLAS